ncbi:unnamed protein product [Medioppia subpectinata]|uniref:Probable tRNA(His) guanylyltransferase n=1 Tax=Medioppia subpectinata TaxID=1979941 RepID=A0A7R9PXH8_9ACAR|nr:unnamed protein product [Medioppia subpectinata]CAG2104819.1 unnamed protein product [Medioppia subpectinata]
MGSLRIMRDCFIVVRIDGQKFHKFSKRHNFLKPNDKRCLDLMNESAKHVMKAFFPNIVIAYGQSDEFSFIIRRVSDLYKRRQNKITSLIVSSFTSAFVFYWSQYFVNNSTVANDCHQSVPLQYPPAFDGRCVLYPNAKVVMDYLRWRQVDCHINNLYNTTFHALTGQYTKYVANTSGDNCYSFSTDWRPQTGDRPAPLTAREATERLSKTVSSDKHEILFTEYGINYNNELEQFKKGSVIHLNISQQLLESIVSKNKKKHNILNQLGDEAEDTDINQYLSLNYIDIIKEDSLVTEEYDFVVTITSSLQLQQNLAFVNIKNQWLDYFMYLKNDSRLDSLIRDSNIPNKQNISFQPNSTEKSDQKKSPKSGYKSPPKTIHLVRPQISESEKLERYLSRKQNLDVLEEQNMLTKEIKVDPQSHESLGFNAANEPIVDIEKPIYIKK